MSDSSIPTDILQVHSHAGAADFDEFYPLSITNYSEIRLFTRQDFINLEYDDRVILTFTPDNPALIPIVLRLKESTSETLVLLTS